MTGDFKIDAMAEDGMINLTRFGELGREGVLALLCDSTNVERPGYTPSEKKVAESFERQFSGCRERIIVTTFASNAFRLQSLLTCLLYTSCPLLLFCARHRTKFGDGRNVKKIVYFFGKLCYTSNSIAIR